MQVGDRVGPLTRGMQVNVADGVNACCAQTRAVPAVRGSISGLGKRLEISGSEARPKLASIIVAGDQGIVQSSANNPDSVSPFPPSRGGSPQILPKGGGDSAFGASAGSHRADSDVAHHPNKVILPDLNLMIPSSSNSTSRVSGNRGMHRELDLSDADGGERFDWADDLESNQSFEDDNDTPEDVDASDDEVILCPDSVDSVEHTLVIASKLGVFGNSKGKSEEHFINQWHKRQAIELASKKVGKGKCCG